MSQTLPEPAGVRQALREIAAAREHLLLASDALSAYGTAEAVVPEARQLETGELPGDLLDIAREVIHQVLPEGLAQRALQQGTTPRDWLYRVHTLSIAPRGISEPVATIVLMLAAVKFGLRHRLLLQTEMRLGLPHKAPIPQLELFLETLLSEMAQADEGDVHFNAWLRRTVADHYPGFRQGQRLDLPNGHYLIIPETIEPICPPSAAPMTAAPLTSPMDPAAAVIIPPGSGWRITLGYAEILYDEAYPAFHKKRHSGIDIYRWNAHGAPVRAMRSGLVIDSVYLPKGFGNTVVVEHADGTCLRYTHLDKKLVRKGERVERGQQIGTVGKGAKNIYPAHLHLDLPRSRAYARARTYYDTTAEVAERFIDPLSQIAAAV